MWEHTEKERQRMKMIVGDMSACEAALLVP